MLVWPDSKRKGSFNAKVINKFDNKVENRYFGVRKYSYPKLAAERWVDERLCEIYGKSRAEFISTIPHYVTRFKWGCGVSVEYENKKKGRRKADSVYISWREYDSKINKTVHNKIRFALTDSTKENRQIEHYVHMIAVKKRSELTLSNVHESAFNFEYDLFG